MMYLHSSWDGGGIDVRRGTSDASSDDFRCEMGLGGRAYEKIYMVNLIEIKYRYDTYTLNF